jgi:hypothetical protein
MFWLAFVYLMLVAGSIHRASSPSVTPIELRLMAYGLVGLWPIIAVETWIAVFIRDRTTRPFFSTLIRAIWITLIPPIRMGMPCPFTGQIWLPFLGWSERGKPLEDRLERGFHVPMLIFALLILPILAFEFVKAEEVRANPELALALDISVAIIWIAFALEFIIKVSSIRRPFVYSKQRWLDLAIVLVPMLEFALKSFAEAAPLARLLRMSRAMSPEQLARMGQMYRLRGLMMKGFRAFLVLRVVAKLTGNTPEKQLRTLETQIGEMETMLGEMRSQADLLRKNIDADAAAEAAAGNSARVYPESS